MKWVLDPFCGRGTTNFAARILGLPSVGIDTSPIAVSIAKAKLATAEPHAVVRAAERLIAETPELDTPTSEFWGLAFHPKTLRDLVRLRAGLLQAVENPAHVLLRAIVLGALHGPLSKGVKSYLSNQSPRTFAPKPGYAVQFWKSRHLAPENVDVLGVIRLRAYRYLANLPAASEGKILLDDGRNIKNQNLLCRFSYVITSPPYYGMRTYIPDQWLRYWFLGGPEQVTYLNPAGSLTHESLDSFISGLAEAWRAVSNVCEPHAKLVCRFGAIRDRDHDPVDIIKASLSQTDWKLLTIRSAGDSLAGKRQARQFGSRIRLLPREEYDFYARLRL
jgi:hypothetical protein